MLSLIPINYDNERQTVSGRSLHEFLEVATEYRHWFPRMCEYGFAENVDYTPFIFDHPQNCQPTTDHQLTIEMAKEISMLQRTEKGKQARQYFIELEKQWNSPEYVMARALKLADKKILSLQSNIQTLLPKAECFDMFIDGSNLQTMNDVAKCIGIGRNKLFAILRDKKILRQNNTPYAEYMDRGYFEVKEKPIKMGDITQNMLQTFCTPKGVSYISKIIQ
jgi:anti-repressor protein